MKTMIVALLLGAAAASPVMAQMPRPMVVWNSETFWRGAPDNPYDRIQFLQDRVNRGMTDGSLSPRDAARANRELAGVRGWIQREHWQDGGRLTPDQRMRVQARLDQISRQIRWMKQFG